MNDIPINLEGKSGTLAEGVVIREDATLADGFWQIEKVAGPPPRYRHGAGNGDESVSRPFNVNTVATEIFKYGNRAFALAPDLYRRVGPEVMEDLSKRPAPLAAGLAGRRMRLTPVDAAPGRVRRPESKPEDKLWVETTLGDAEEFLQQKRESVMPNTGAEARITEALLEATKAHREGWRELPPVIMRQQVDGASVARRGPLFPRDSRVKFKKGNYPFATFVVMSSTFVGEGTEPGYWQYALSEDGTSAKSLQTNPHREDELEAALTEGRVWTSDEPTEEEKQQDIANRLVADLTAVDLAEEALTTIPREGRVGAVEIYLAAWARTEKTFEEARAAWGMVPNRG